MIAFEIIAHVLGIFGFIIAVVGLVVLISMDGL